MSVVSVKVRTSSCANVKDNNELERKIEEFTSLGFNFLFIKSNTREFLLTDRGRVISPFTLVKEFLLDFKNERFIKDEFDIIVGGSKFDDLYMGYDKEVSTSSLCLRYGGASGGGAEEHPDR